jgi:uncharacterized protein (TIGR02611 family)
MRSLDRLRSLRARVRALPGGRIAWRVGITVAGIGVILIGIVLLPLPGPGWLIIFAGLGILATEYAWAAQLLRRTRRLVRRWTQWLLAQPPWTQRAVGLVTFAVVVVVAWAAWFIGGTPGL